MKVAYRQVWRYRDAIDVERIGYFVSFTDRGGTDVTYRFERKDGSGIDLVSGPRLKQAERIGAEKME